MEEENKDSEQEREENKAPEEQETSKKRPLNPTESFVHEMVESSKKKFDPPKPNQAEEDHEEVERLTKKIKDDIQRS